MSAAVSRVLVRLAQTRPSSSAANVSSRALSSVENAELVRPSVSETLKRFLMDKIRSTGPITVAEYMKVVSAPQVGYYSQFSQEKLVFGPRGDFITAPELTQLFGEMMGVWIYHELAHTSHQGEWQLVECGPGTGSLMRDILGVLHKFQDTKASVHLVETSQALMDEQERVLCGYNATPSTSKEKVSWVKRNKTKSGLPIFWYSSLDDVPFKFSVFVANEFLDALPVHQFVRTENGQWRERYVNVTNGGRLCFMDSRGENLHSKGLVPPAVRDDTTMNSYEISPDAGTFVNQIAERLVSYGGLALVVDYGHNGDRKNLSLRAYDKHEQVDPLERPGEVDITADVNFGYLRTLVEDRVLVYGPINQRNFLLQMGIRLRLRMVLNGMKDEEKQKQLIGAYNFLMGEMGEKFKVMSFFPRTLKGILDKRGAPAGFATELSSDAKEKSAGDSF